MTVEQLSSQGETREVRETSGKSSSSGAPSGELINLQVLRAVAALIVVWIHLRHFADPVGIPVPAGGIELFFVISGFIMVYTTRKPTTPSHFIRKRIARVVPIYWLFTFFTFACAVIYPAAFRNTSGSIADLLLSLLFVPFAKAAGQFPQPVLFVGWTLNYEMFFYAVFAACLCLRNRIAGVLAACAILSLLALIGTVVQPASVLGEFYTRPILLNFVFGMAIALGHELLDTPRSPKWGWLMLFLAPAAAITLMFLHLALPRTPVLWTIWVPAGIMVLLATHLERQGHVLRSRILVAIGDASYSLYLCHFFVAGLFIAIAAASGATGWWNVPFFLTGMAVACAAAILIHTYVERPLSRWAGSRLHAAPGRRIGLT